jgi:hypothetical protein
MPKRTRKKVQRPFVHLAQNQEKRLVCDEESVLDQAEYTLRIAFRRTEGRGPEWARVEWLIMETMRQRPIRKIWDSITTKEEQFLMLLAKVQKPLPLVIGAALSARMLRRVALVLFTLVA